mgnify:CR=1 FL=1
MQCIEHKSFLIWVVCVNFADNCRVTHSEIYFAWHPIFNLDQKLVPNVL